MTGNFSLAFMTHNIVHQILVHSNNKSKLVRDVGIAYIFGALFYTIVGTFGSIGILGRVSEVDEDKR